VLKREQIEAVVRIAEGPKGGYLAAFEAARIGVTTESLRVMVCNYRQGRIPLHWRRFLKEPA
jgi:hypothetical protein